jgi:hypothetical protein
MYDVIDELRQALEQFARPCPESKNIDRRQRMR